MEDIVNSLQIYFKTFKNSESNESSDKKISYFELMGISWSLHLLYAFYSVFALYLGVKSYSYFSESESFSHLVFNSINAKFQKITMITTLFVVIFYPFLFKFAFKAWKAIFKFYINLFDLMDEQFEIKTNNILNSAFSSNLFLILPIVGKVLSNLAHGFFVFKGLKRNYEFTSLQASLVLLTPVFLIFLIMIFVASYFIFLVSLI